MDYFYNLAPDAASADAWTARGSPRASTTFELPPPPKVGSKEFWADFVATTLLTAAARRAVRMDDRPLEFPWRLANSTPFPYEKGSLSATFRRLAGTDAPNASTIASIVHRDLPWALMTEAFADTLAAEATPRRLFAQSSQFLNSIVLAGEMLAGAGAHAAHKGWCEKWKYRYIRPQEIAQHVLAGRIAAPVEVKIALRDYAVPGAIGNSSNYFTSYREGAPKHPSYPSGHAIFAGAGAYAIRYFMNLSAAADENVIRTANLVGYGRTIAGLHYLFDVAAGLHLGQACAAEYIKERMTAYGADPAMMGAAHEAALVPWAPLIAFTESAAPHPSWVAPASPAEVATEPPLLVTAARSTSKGK